MEMLTEWIEWLRDHPAALAGAAIAVAGLWWYLRRPDPVLQQGAKEFDRLSQKNRGKYDDLRPLK